MTWYDKIIAAHTAITDQVSHFERMQSDRYFVWQEDGLNSLNANDIHIETAVTGSTDLFTKQEFDPWVDALGAAFDQAGIAWSLNSIQHEDDAGFIHYEWYWEVI